MTKFNRISFLRIGAVLLSLSSARAIVFLFTRSMEEFRIQWTVYEAEGLIINLSFLFDIVRMLFFRTVTMISGGVFIYASRYIDGDKFSARFRFLVMSFVGSIVILIFTRNIITLLLGWDGLGVTSYLLVCYYCREKRFNARILTALTNRIGDVAILLYISQMTVFGVYNFSLWSRSNNERLSICFILVVIAAITKRAQIPFSAWLPAAMAAPTPVSALVHSSTLVTAGVYLLIRHNYILQARGWVWAVLWLGLTTIVIAGGAALFELDIKKIIALSTLRQLGVIFFSLGLGLPFMSFFHLVAHAYFKAILFIAAGAVIHRVKDYQDLRKIGRFQGVMPRLSRVIVVRNLRLCGLPFMSGFYSKDVILERIIMNGLDAFIWVGAIIGTFLTVLYSCRFRLGVLVRHSKREAFSGEGDRRVTIAMGMAVLIIPSVIGGWGLSGTDSFGALVYLGTWIKVFILAIILCCSVLVLGAGSLPIRPLRVSRRFVHQIWFIPALFRPELTSKGLKYSGRIVKTRDNRWTPALSWTWLISGHNRMDYVVSIFQVATISSAIIIFLLRVYQ